MLSVAVGHCRVSLLLHDLASVGRAVVVGCMRWMWHVDGEFFLFSSFAFVVFHIHIYIYIYIFFCFFSSLFVFFVFQISFCVFSNVWFFFFFYMLFSLIILLEVSCC